MFTEPTLDRQGNVLWGKSNAGGHVNLLLQHLLDSAAVGELIWDRYLAPVDRQRLDSIFGGRGRSVISLLCSLHDIGKATPAFQSKDVTLATKVQMAGLDWDRLTARDSQCHHTVAGAIILFRILSDRGLWSGTQWLVPLIAGHHGIFPTNQVVISWRSAYRAIYGTGPWSLTQDSLVNRLERLLAVDLKILCLADPGVLRLSRQLQLAGLMVMADWIASDELHFPGVDAAEDMSMTGARQRAETAWSALKLNGGWDPTALLQTDEIITTRFPDIDMSAVRDVQRQAIEAARCLPGPGLMIIEAPTGEGKTEAALAAAEVLAARIGANGVYIGMPTQATSDQMWERVLRWSQTMHPAPPVGLLHGRRRFNKQWQQLNSQISYAGIGIEDEYGCEDIYGLSDQKTARPNAVPAQWFLGAKRGLLMPVAVGTIDHLLFAMAKTRHVMLRHAGLAGRVVILDEVHAYDAYTSQFLREALSWLGNAGVQVIMLTATLPPAMRNDFVRAYMQGCFDCRDPDISAFPHSLTYPHVLVAWPQKDTPQIKAFDARPSQLSRALQIDTMSVDQPQDIAQCAAEAVRDGGCALVIQNTVRRAQQVYSALCETGNISNVMLLHSRLIARARSERTQQATQWLGPQRGQNRPWQCVIVATQVAEQSLDIDADFLITDLAPIDILVQRAGRLHRHVRFGRPANLRTPRMVITGMQIDDDGVYQFPVGNVRVYGRYLLCRAAGMVQQAVSGSGWHIPQDVPGLVARCYDDQPDPSEAAAYKDWCERRDSGKARAREYLLLGENNLGALTLAGLNAQAAGDRVAEAYVRDGPPRIEVALIQVCESGYRTLSGHYLGIHGEGISDPDVLAEVEDSVLQLPVQLHDLALELQPLPGWVGHPWLHYIPAFVLDQNLSAEFGAYEIRYDNDLGLLIDRVE